MQLTLGDPYPIAKNCDWDCEITVGGVRRKETDQEKRDRQLAMRLVKEQEECGKFVFIFINTPKFLLSYILDIWVFVTSL